MSTNTTTLPFTSPDWKIPGYTGYVNGLQETYKKTPIMAQLETKEPDADFSFIHTRTQVPHKTTLQEANRDPCNHPETLKKPQPGNLWPNLQTKAIQDSFRPPQSNISFGDGRVDTFKTSYWQDYNAPFPGHDRLRSPNRNEDLGKTTASLSDIFRSAYNRVGDKRLQKMISTMRERMEAKQGNSNDNAFRIRTLFLKWDKDSSGMVHYEDLRQMCESFGMQLDDDSLLALFYIYDPEGTGYLAYMDLVKHLMDPGTFCYYIGNVDNSTDAIKMQQTKLIISQAGKKLRPVIADLEMVLSAFDQTDSGYLCRSDIIAGCAAMGVVLSDKELQSMAAVMKTNSSGEIDYKQMCTIFAQ
eukprot:gene13487-19345_t